MGFPVVSHLDLHGLLQTLPEDSEVPRHESSGHMPYCKNDEYTANTGFIPPAASPAANVTACSSAIPHQKSGPDIFPESCKSRAVFHCCRDRCQLIISCRLIAHYFTKTSVYVSFFSGFRFSRLYPERFRFHGIFPAFLLPARILFLFW